MLETKLRRPLNEEFGVYPAIDIRNGKCVRLIRGDYSRQTVFSDRPEDVAKGFADCGAKFLHVVDLDGAASGDMVNFRTIESICSKTSLRVQVGGGIRNRASVRSALDAGAFRVIMGTTAIKDPALFRDICEEFCGFIANAIDVRDNKVSVSGWLEDSSKDPVSFAEELLTLNVSSSIVTDISRDGLLSGPNLDLCEKVSDTGMDVIISGGVSSMDDIRKIAELASVKAHISGVIIGRALYTKALKLEEVIGEFEK